MQQISLKGIMVVLLVKQGIEDVQSVSSNLWVLGGWDKVLEMMISSKYLG